MAKESSAINDLIRMVATRPVADDPGDELLFQRPAHAGPAKRKSRLRLLSAPVVRPVPALTAGPVSIDYTGQPTKAVRKVKRKREVTPRAIIATAVAAVFVGALAAGYIAFGHHEAKSAVVSEVKPPKITVEPIAAVPQAQAAPAPAPAPPAAVPDPAPATVPDPAPAPAAATDPAPARAEVRSPKPEARSGTLMLGSKPPCEILIDGKPTHLTTPQKSLAVSAGYHRVTFVNAERHIHKTVAVRVSAHRPTKLVRSFL